MQKKDIRLEIKARNNLVLSKMEERGIETVAELCRQMEKRKIIAHQVEIGALINMKLSARVGDKLGNAWRQSALNLAKFLRCMPEDLFSDPQQYKKLTSNRIKAEFSFAEIERLTASPNNPEQLYDRKEVTHVVSRVLATLTPREERILRMRFGIGNEEEHLLEEIGQEFSYTRERIRMIEAKALRKLKHPSRSRMLRACLDTLDA